MYIIYKVVLVKRIISIWKTQSRLALGCVTTDFFLKKVFSPHILKAKQ